MPTYDYACSTCGHHMEVLHAVTAHGPRMCPNCGGPMRKLFAPPTIHFKGSGWAKKDRAGSGHRSGHKGSTSTDKEGGSGAESTSGSEATADSGSASTGSGATSGAGPE